MKQIGQALLMHRAAHKKGVRQLGKEIGVSAATVSRIERDEDISGKTLLKLINWLFSDV